VPLTGIHNPHYGPSRPHIHTEAPMPEISIRKLTDEELESLRDEMYGKLEGLNKDDALEILEILKAKVDDFSIVGPKDEG